MVNSRSITVYFYLWCFLISACVFNCPSAFAANCSSCKSNDVVLYPFTSLSQPPPNTEIDWPREIPKTYCPTDYDCYWQNNVINDIRRDFITYFRVDNLLQFGTVFVAAGILANTGLDRTIRENWQEDFESNRTHRFFKPFKMIGGLSYWYFPIYFTAMGIGYWRHCDQIGNIVYQWGYRNLRAMILGGLQVIILAPTLGSGRPCKHEPSKWQPFKYVNGVSGHAFFGALPFITAAMLSEPPLLKGLLYIASALPGLSRVDSDAHWFSQVLLGWSLAFFSARAVYESDLANPAFQASLIPKPNGCMIYGQWNY